MDAAVPVPGQEVAQQVGLDARHRGDDDLDYRLDIAASQVHEKGRRHTARVLAGKDGPAGSSCLEDREPVVGPQEALESSALLATDVTFISGQTPAGATHVEAQVRYRSPAVPATLFPREDGFRVDFVQPQRAVTPGQAVVFYRGAEVLGGGTIQAALRP